MALKPANFQYSKDTLFDRAIEITKEFCRGGSEKLSPDYVLQKVYETLKELAEDAMK